MTGRRSHGRLSALNGVVHQGNRTPVVSPKGDLMELLQSLGARSVLHDTVSDFMFEGSVLLHRRLEPLFSELRVTRCHSPSE